MWSNTLIHETWRIVQPLSGQNHGPSPPKTHKQPYVCTCKCVYVYVRYVRERSSARTPPLTRNSSFVCIGFSLKWSTQEGPDKFFDASTKENMIAQTCDCMWFNACLFNYKKTFSARVNTDFCFFDMIMYRAYYKVARTHRIPYLRSFSAKVTNI